MTATTMPGDDRAPDFDPDVAAQQEPMYAFLEDVLTHIGPRESCSDEEKKLGEQVAKAWEGLGYRVQREPFSCHPKAFLAPSWISPTCYALAMVAYWWQPLIAALICAGYLALLFFETLNYRHIIDPLFPKREGINVGAIVPCKGERKRRVLVNAHLDSAYEFSLWYWLGNYSSPLMVIAFLAGFVPMVGGLLAFTGWGSETVVVTLGWIGVGLLPPVLSFYFMVSSRPVPGAMDDLSGIGIMIGLGDLLAKENPLENTEVLILATSSEEAGLRGAEAWARAHREEIAALPTHAIVIDGCYDPKMLRAVGAELLPFVRHDRGMVELATAAAAKRGREMAVSTVPLGASDGTVFTRAGIKSTLLMCQDISRLVPNYHTRNDTLDFIEPVSLTILLQVIKDMLVKLDGEDRRS